MDEASLLARVRLFAGLPPAALARVAAALVVKRVVAGQDVMRQGERADSMYIIRSGRVEVLVDGTVVRTAARGDAIGELALLGAGVRTATVRAIRDTELLSLSGEVFQSLLAAEPTFTAALIRELALRVPRGDLPSVPRRSGAVVAVVAGQPDLTLSRVMAVAQSLANNLAAWETVRVLGADDGPPEDWPALLDRAESEHTWTILAPDDAGEWGRFCCRQADRVLAVADPHKPIPAASPAARALDLVLLGDARVAQWLDRWEPQTHHVIRRDSREDLARLARRVAGRSVGVVLSGGGARGFAHLGALEALFRAGVTVDRVGGTSMGAFVAALTAREDTVAQMQELVRREFVQRSPFRDYTWPRHSLIRAHRATRMLERVFGDALIEEQARSMFCVSTDLVGAEEVVLRRGPIAVAAGRSMSLPGVAPPQRDGRRLHVDGGVLNNMPVDVMAADAEGPVIAVDVMRPFEGGSTVGTPERLPGIVDTIGRSMVLGSWRKAEAGRLLARLVIAPGMDGIGMFDFAKLDEIVRLGRKAAEQSLDNDPDFLAELR